MIKKTLLTIGLIILSLGSFAQSAVQQADRAFAVGNYSDATQLYEIAASTVAGNGLERKKLYDAANKCRKVSALQAQANKAYKAHNYKLAVDYYNQILKYNPHDSRAKTRVFEYVRIKEDIAWKNVCSAQSFMDKVNASQEYLTQYPSGRFKEEVSKILKEEEDWRTAKAANTYEAYQNYINHTVLEIYVKDAKIGISRIDDNLWRQTRQINTLSSYKKYINLQKNKNGKYLKDANDLCNLMYARDLYYRDDYVKAYEYFVKAKHYVTSSSDIYKIKQCLEYIYYIKACSDSGTIEDCQAYLNEFSSNATHYREVEDKIMWRLCQEGRFDEAMKYATLKSEKKFVTSAKKAWIKAHK